MSPLELKPPVGAKRPRKRIGRGNASGHGTYATKGMKGQKARAGKDLRPGFEGGQNPMIRKMARKRGFNNKFRVEYSVVNVGALQGFQAKSEVTPQTLEESRILRTLDRPVKILGQGELKVALTVSANKFSATAREKIEAAGGKVLEI